MADAYHNEALRRQRMIDRAAEARERMEEKGKPKYVNKAIQVGGEKVSSSSNKSSRKKHHHRIDRKVTAVRRDLHKQEMILRDSNLVMGPVSVAEEVALRKVTSRK